MGAIPCGCNSTSTEISIFIVFNETSRWLMVDLYHQNKITTKNATPLEAH